MGIRILQFGRHFPPHIGGTETVMHDLALGLNERDVQCDVLCCNDGNSYEITDYEKFRVFRTGSLIRFAATSLSPQQITKLGELAKYYDIIHIHHPSPMATLALRLVNPTKKVVLSWHSDIIKQKTLLKLYKPLQNWLIKRADTIVATTPAYIQKSDALLKYPVKTTYIPLGIKEMPKADEGVISGLRRRYLGKKVIFSLGRLVEYKGFEYLIKAAKFLNDDTLVVIGGDGPLRPKLEAMIINEGVRDKVILAGRLSDSDVNAHYELCEIFCLSSVSKNEAFGLVLIEAMSKGKPIVATRIPGSGVSWVNEHGVTGYNVSVGSPEEISEVSNNILQNRALSEQLSRNASARFREIFTKDRMVDDYLNLYLSLTKR